MGMRDCSPVSTPKAHKVINSWQQLAWPVRFTRGCASLCVIAAALTHPEQPAQSHAFTFIGLPALPDVQIARATTSPSLNLRLPFGHEQSCGWRAVVQFQPCSRRLR
jgi:hypothetical protein